MSMPHGVMTSQRATAGASTVAGSASFAFRRMLVMLTLILSFATVAIGFGPARYGYDAGSGYAITLWYGLLDALLLLGIVAGAPETYRRVRARTANPFVVAGLLLVAGLAVSCAIQPIDRGVSIVLRLLGATIATDWFAAQPGTFGRTVTRWLALVGTAEWVLVVLQRALGGRPIGLLLLGERPRQFFPFGDAYATMGTFAHPYMLAGFVGSCAAVAVVGALRGHVSKPVAALACFAAGSVSILNLSRVTVLGLGLVAACLVPVAFSRRAGVAGADGRASGLGGSGSAGVAGPTVLAGRGAPGSNSSAGAGDPGSSGSAGSAGVGTVATSTGLLGLAGSVRKTCLLFVGCMAVGAGLSLPFNLDGWSYKARMNFSKEEGLTSGRTMLLRENLGVFRENPWFGVGTGRYALSRLDSGLWRDAKTPPPPHNIVLAALTEGGALVIPSLLAHAYALLALIRKRNWLALVPVAWLASPIMLEQFMWNTPEGMLMVAMCLGATSLVPAASGQPVGLFSGLFSGLAAGPFGAGPSAGRAGGGRARGARHGRG